MKCGKCDQYVDIKCKYIECSVCYGTYHFSCLENVTDNEFDFLKSTPNWKCYECKSRRKGDETPLTPISSQKVSAFKEIDSGSDSSSASNANVAEKIICSTCSKGFSHNAHRACCVKCLRVFHLKKECVSITKDNYFKNKSKWICQVCAGMDGAKDSQRSADKAEQSTSRGLLALSDSDKVGGDVTLIAIMNEMKAFRAEVNKTNNCLEENMNKYSDWVVEQGKKIDDVSKKLTDLCSEMVEIRQENLNLKKQVAALTFKVESMEQSAKENEIEISGVPSSAQENVLDIVERVATAIGFDFNGNMIDNCYRYKAGPKQQFGGIVVKFVRKLDMQNFVAKRRNKRNVNTRDIGIMNGEASPIYVNYSLTREKRKLLNAARLIKREKQYTFLWVNNGRIFMRKDPGGQKIMIESEEDLAKLK